MEGWSGKRSSVLDQLWTWGGNEEEEEDVDEVPGQEEGEDETIMESMNIAEVKEGKSASDRFKYFYCF